MLEWKSKEEMAFMTSLYGPFFTVITVSEFVITLKGGDYRRGMEKLRYDTSPHYIDGKDGIWNLYLTGGGEKTVRVVLDALDTLSIPALAVKDEWQWRYIIEPEEYRGQPVIAHRRGMTTDEQSFYEIIHEVFS